MSFHGEGAMFLPGTCSLHLSSVLAQYNVGDHQEKVIQRQCFEPLEVAKLRLVVVGCRCHFKNKQTRKSFIIFSKRHLLTAVTVQWILNFYQIFVK